MRPIRADVHITDDQLNEIEYQAVEERQEAMMARTKVLFSGAEDLHVRGKRFAEEALETFQSVGGTREEAHFLVDYVFGRDIGELWQEIGGSLVTLRVLAEAAGLNSHYAEKLEWERINSLSDEYFKERHKKKLEAGL